jgi:transposase
VDTFEQVILDETPKQIVRRRRSVEEKRRIVEETLETGASVARVARRHAVNANQVFYWRQKYREGRLGKVSSSNLLPVTISEIPTNKSGQVGGVGSRCSSGTMEIQVAKGQLRVTGNVEAEALRTVLEYLLG